MCEQTILDSIDPKQLKQYALRLLASREYSRKLLLEKIKFKFKPDLIPKNLEYKSEYKSELKQELETSLINTANQVLTQLEQREYLCDSRFAQAKSRYLIRRHYGKNFIIKKLYQDGISNFLAINSIEISLDELELDWPKIITNFLNKNKYIHKKTDYSYHKKWQNKLYQRGFELSDIRQVINK